MAGWNDLGAAFSTLRELDITAIREESERTLTIACLGASAVTDLAVDLLQQGGSRRYGPVGSSPLLVGSIAEDTAAAADMVLILFDGRQPVAKATVAALQKLARLGLPTTIVLWYVELPENAASALQPIFAHAHVVAIADPHTPNAAQRLAEAILERLPADFHLAVARRLPGMRPAVARQLINSTAFANASYAVATALPEQIPVLGLPFAAADMLVLTKNQALMVYKLGLANGAPPEFTARLREVLPVIGGGYIWRQLARSLVALIPIWGVVPKVAIAYAGTYTTGFAAWRWFADAEIVSPARLRTISEEALAVGRERAAALIAAAKARGSESSSAMKRFGARVRAALPFGKSKDPADSAPES